MFKMELKISGLQNTKKKKKTLREKVVIFFSKDLAGQKITA